MVPTRATSALVESTVTSYLPPVVASNSGPVARTGASEPSSRYVLPDCRSTGTGPLGPVTVGIGGAAVAVGLAVGEPHGEVGLRRTVAEPGTVKLVPAGILTIPAMPAMATENSTMASTTRITPAQISPAGFSDRR